MGEASITESNWRLVEVGRVVLLQGDSPYAGRLATIVEIVDHKRVRSFSKELLAEESREGGWGAKVGQGNGETELVKERAMFG